MKKASIIEKNKITLLEQLEEVEENAILKVDMELIIYDETDNKQTCKIVEIYDENNFKIDIDIEGDIVFVYGSVVEDFHILNKEYINCVNISATQELLRKIELQTREIDELKNTIANIMTRLETGGL